MLLQRPAASLPHSTQRLYATVPRRPSGIEPFLRRPRSQAPNHTEVPGSAVAPQVAPCWRGQKRPRQEFERSNSSVDS